MNSPPINLGTSGLVLGLRLYTQSGSAAPTAVALGSAAVVEIGTSGEYYLSNLPDPGTGYVGTAVAYQTSDPASAFYTYTYTSAGAVPGVVPVVAVHEPLKWIVGEYGAQLQVAMPFDSTGGTVVIKVRRPAELTWRTWTADVVTVDAVEHTILAGELNRVGLYRGVVEVTTEGQLRKAVFSFVVAGITGAELEGSTA